MNDATSSAGEALHGSQTTRFEVTISDHKLILWVDAKTEKPVRVSLLTGMKTNIIEYLGYEELPFDPSLFRPPAGVSFVNAQ